MRYYKKLQYFGIAIIASSALLLAGCARKPVKHQSKPTIAQLRMQYEKSLCAVGIKIIKRGETVKLLIPSDDLFAGDSANLMLGYRAILNTVANLIKTYDIVTVKVTGFSDNYIPKTAPKEKKKALTARQAQVVASYLWSRKINTRIIVAQGKGKKHPIAMNNSPYGQALNRRIQISFRYYPKVNPYN